MAVRRTDIHTHILPGIDDGAKLINDSIELLSEQKKQGINQVIFTPHFMFSKQNNMINDIELFIEKRDNSLKSLTENSDFRKLDISYKIGAEVYYSVNLADYNILKDLSVVGTRYILVELPTQSKPHGLTYVFDNIVNNGFTPVIAHVERYSYLLNDLMLLYRLVDNGCLTQINSEIVIHKDKRFERIEKMIKMGLVHLMSSDCHSLKRRPPNLDKGYSLIQKMSDEYCSYIEENSNLLFDDQIIDNPFLRKPIRFFGFWR